MQRKIGSITLFALAMLAAVVVARLGFWSPIPPPLPSGAPRQVAAHLSALEGKVQWKRQGTLDWLSARKQTALAAGDQVRTSPGAAAEITFLDGFVVRVARDTLVSIETPVRHDRRTVLGVRAGYVTGDANDGGSQAEINTPVARWRGVSGEAPPAVDIGVQSSRDTTVSQRRGSGEVVSADGTQRTLHPRTGVKVARDGTAAAVEELPETPDLLSPPHGSTLSYPDPAHAVTRLRWRAVPGAASYRLWVDHGGFFLQPAIDQGDIREPQWELSGLPDGKYYWKVASIDRQGRESTSEFARFAIVDTRAPPPLVIDIFETRGNVVRLSGRTQPGSAVTINGQAVDVRSDGRFAEFVALARGRARTVVVRSSTPTGLVVEEKRQVEGS
jgi:hypothetical protein